MSRRIAILAHTGRRQALVSAAEARRELASHGLIPVMARREIAQLEEYEPDNGIYTEIIDREKGLDDIELVMVLGGDGTILRAAELTRKSGTPLLGVNLGHVGFLAESEKEDLTETVRRIVEKDYRVEERLTLDAKVIVDGALIKRTWAINEVAIEKANRERMVELVLEIDGRPVSTFGCDGVVLATPTGSTAYAFSGGGPVVWPQVEALLAVPLSAHALFARPLVVGPDSKLAVELVNRSGVHAVMWADGRREVPLPPGARVVVRRSDIPFKLARLRQGPFTDRLVRKFGLPVEGWRGPVTDDEIDASGHSSSGVPMVTGDAEPRFIAPPEPSFQEPPQ